MGTKVERDNSVITVAQAAQSIGRSKMTIYRWADEGIIKSRIVGGKLFILKKEVRRLKHCESSPGKESSRS
jgi:excisionase family DNA binding protein